MLTIYDPELVKALLGDSVAELFDGTIKIIPSKSEMFGNLTVGDTLEFKLKEDYEYMPIRQFVITEVK